MIITSVSNPKIKEIAALRGKKNPRGSRVFIAEGFKLARDIPPSVKILKYVVLDGAAGTADFPYREGAEIITASANVFQSLSDVKTPQGILALAEIPEPNGLSDAAALVLDRVRDPGNVGTLLRSAAAFGFLNAALIDCAGVYSPKALRASMGGVFRLSIFQTSEAELFRRLPKNRFYFIGLDADGDRDISELLSVNAKNAENTDEKMKKRLAGGGDIFAQEPLNAKNANRTPPSAGERRLALIVGNESGGISERLLRECDVVLSIGMENGVESLNAAAAGSIAMHALREKISGFVIKNVKKL
ncbi:MAG: RNA methyltransferase [Clostridiales bacterium]|jgi:TrmH family RNA methyltransferase|nr:RNA methyltransferase [Clostridiales bacterium]